jgi:hypothetical protein
MIDPVTGFQIASAIGGLLGKKKKKGTAAIPAQGVYEGYNNIKKFKDSKFIDDTLPQALMDLLNTPFQGRPMRRASSSEMSDPNFAPQGIMDSQRFFDGEASMNGQQPQPQPQQQAAPQQSGGDDMYAKMMLMQGAMGDNPRQAQGYKDNLSNMSSEDLAALGKLFREKGAKFSNSGLYGGSFLGSDGAAIDAGQYLDRQRRG